MNSTCLNCSTDFKYDPHHKTGKYCTSKCCGEHKAKLNLQENIQLFKEGKLEGRWRIYDVLVELHGNQCSKCEITEWQGKPIRLWVDHADGDATNNQPDNLRLICPNCDSQQVTFGAKNYGKGRKSRGLRQYS